MWYVIRNYAINLLNVQFVNIEQAHKTDYSLCILRVQDNVKNHYIKFEHESNCLNAFAKLVDALNKLEKK